MRCRRSKRTSSRAPAVYQQAALIAEGLHVLPDFIGARSPSADPGARGAVMGMDLREDAASLQELYVAAPLRPRLWPRRHRAQARAVRLTHSIPSSSAAAPREARWSARSLRTCAARWSNRPRLWSRCCSARRWWALSRRGRRPWPRRCRRCRRSRPAAPRPLAERSRRSMRESDTPLRCCGETEREIRALTRKSRWPEAGHFRLRRGAGRQRSDRARRHPPQAWRGGPSPDR